MRTAEEIMEDEFSECELKKLSDNARRFIIDAINEARKQVIEECAERAKSEWVRYGTNMGHAVDKQSILSLINELE